MAKKVLVLGGTGLLGHATIVELLKRDYEVVSLALPPMPVDDLFTRLGGRVESVLADVTTLSDDEVSDLLQGCHGVMYAAGADERITPAAPATKFFYEVNVLPTQRLARLAVTAGVEHFVVYGSYFAEFAERLPETGLRDEPYPLTRLLQEQMAFCEGEGAMVANSLRLPYIFGTMPGRMPLWKMFSDQLNATDVFPVQESGITASITARQVGEAAVGAMERGVHRGTYAISSHNLRLADLYRIMLGRLGRSDKVHLPDVPVEQIEPAMAALDHEAAEQGVQHAISMQMGARLRSLDLGIDPAETQSLLGFGDDDVVAAIHDTMDYILEHQ